MDKISFDVNVYLRYLLTGGVAFGCFFFLNPSSFNEFKVIDFKESIFWVFLDLVFGFTLYISYRALIFPWLYKIILFIALKIVKRKFYWDLLIPYYPTNTEVQEDIRRWEKRKNEKSISKILIQWSSEGHFLYCSALGVLLAINLSLKLGIQYPDRLPYVKWFLGILIASAIITHIRLLVYEQYVFQHEEKQG